MKKNVFSTMAAIESPPPPPPSKRSRKSLIAVIVVLLIVVLAVGVYLAARGFGTNTSAVPTSTPIPGSTSSPAPTTSPSNSGAAANIAGATSLQFTVSTTNSSGGSLGSYTYSAKNAGTPNMMIRVEFTDPNSASNFVYIVNGVLKQAWMQSDGQWIDLSSSFTDQNNSWDSTFKDYQNNLADWSGLGDWTYASPTGETVRIHDISVNPSLPDSLFEHS